MKKAFLVVLSLVFCTCLAFLIPGTSTSNQNVTDSSCLSQCHSVDNLHSTHSDCSACHDGTPAAGNVAASTCSTCHGGLCTIVDAHSESCLACHSDCGDGDDDGDDSDTNPCVVEEIYGSSSPEAELLRAYRDQVLSTNLQGCKLIGLYYQMSPGIVAAMQEDPDLKATIKARIDAILPIVEAQVQ